MSFNADMVLGALLVGTWANSILYTIEIVQAAYYYRHFKQDIWMLKLLVSSAIAFDSVSMIANYTGVYLPDSLYVFTTGVVGALAQSFLAGRYWRLNKFITPTLFFFITVAIGGAFASGATLAIFPEYKDRKKVIIPATTWLITAAVTDISIAVALLLEFRKVKSSFKETKGLLNRLVTQTVQTGAAGATVALAILVAFLAKKESNISTGIGYCIGHVYCITMLANLNSRKAGKTWSGNDTSSGAITQLRDERGNQERGGGGDEYGGIHVHRTAVVHTDTPQEFNVGLFKTKRLPDDSPAVEMEMIVNDSASYSSKNKQDLC
ncbi:hypothetical protein DFH08DRAFT_1079972 [Mycena albidolilacea]|uniref:DUF6534 domain-containing protein n=1 Tax=Mycena albidolilacea TaxID=1033008 RepID=A0AAD7A366_9AGAR|nr:hypothetical protein DFH08DRAFT_1079972 [Mycena albidolilacea]